MKLVILSALFTFTITASSAVAQRTNDNENASVSSDTQMKIPIVAMALEAVLPTIGHAYAGDWNKGLLPNIVRVGGAITTIVGSVSCIDDIFEEEDSGCGMLLLGVLAFTGGGIWAIISANNVAREFNARLRESLGISLGVDARPMGLALTVNF